MQHGQEADLFAADDRQRRNSTHGADGKPYFKVGFSRPRPAKSSFSDLERLALGAVDLPRAVADGHVLTKCGPCIRDNTNFGPQLRDSQEFAPVCDADAADGFTARPCVSPQTRFDREQMFAELLAIAPPRADRRCPSCAT